MKISLNWLKEYLDIKDANQLLSRLTSMGLEVDTVTKLKRDIVINIDMTPNRACLLYTSPSPRDRQKSRMPSSA